VSALRIDLIKDAVHRQLSERNHLLNAQKLTARRAAQGKRQLTGHDITEASVSQAWASIKYNLTQWAAEGCDFLILLLILKSQDQKIAAFGSSYRRLGAGSWRLSGRLRWQASSHSGVGGGQLETGRPVGRHRWQASFPRSRSKIAASAAPTGDCGQLEIGRLSGRLRWQASSHKIKM
jgi:hypothetical protein